MNSIETMLNTFILPLQSVADAEQRVHCSLNLNTETGRLSSRNPNLQNQPALEKDVYFIRKAFMAKPGNILLVSDYGQLELRVLAHMTKCQAMIEAFKSDPFVQKCLEVFNGTIDETSIEPIQTKKE